MTPKQKARELINKFILSLKVSLKLDIIGFRKKHAKNCASIAVDEIIKQEAERCLAYKETDKFIDYWQEVKQEIEKL